MSETYLQIELEDDSKKYLAINTHKGLYCYRLITIRHSFSTSHTYSSRLLSRSFQNYLCYMNATLVTGCNDEEHLQNLTAVFESIRHQGFQIKLSRCKFSKGLSNILEFHEQRRHPHVRLEETSQSNHKYLLSNKCFQIVIISWKGKPLWQIHKESDRFECCT